MYRGLYRNTVVAIKQMVMPGHMDQAEKREKMAIMEAAISSSLKHPNIVQVSHHRHLNRLYRHIPDDTDCLFWHVRP